MALPNLGSGMAGLVHELEKGAVEWHGGGDIAVPGTELSFFTPCSFFLAWKE